MPRGVYDEPPESDGVFDDDIGDAPDPEGPSPEDLERFGDEFRTCPSCGSDVYDQAELCHVCGHAFEEPAGKPPVWILIVLAIALLAMLGLLLF